MPLSPIPPPPSQPTEPLSAASLSSKEAIEGCRDSLATAPARAGLRRLTAEERRGAGVVGTQSRIKLSLSMLRFYQENPQLQGLFTTAQPERHRRLLGLRLQAAQARQVLSRVRSGMDAAELLLRAQLTEDNDRIEDHYTALWQDPQTPPERRTVLEFRFRDPLRLRQLFSESLEQRLQRRSQRRLLRRTARAEAQRLRQAPRDVERLRKLGRPDTDA